MSHGPWQHGTNKNVSLHNDHEADSDERYPTFPERLLMIFEKPEVLGTAVEWNEAGDAFRIHPAPFAEVLQQFFHGTMFESFTRKLSRWGFGRIRDPAFPRDAIVYGHPMFRRNEPLTVRTMKTAENSLQFSKRLSMVPAFSNAFEVIPESAAGESGGSMLPGAVPQPNSNQALSSLLLERALGTAGSSSGFGGLNPTSTQELLNNPTPLLPTAPTVPFGSNAATVGTTRDLISDAMMVSGALLGQPQSSEALALLQRKQQEERLLQGIVAQQRLREANQTISIAIELERQRAMNQAVLLNSINPLSTSLQAQMPATSSGVNNLAFLSQQPLTQPSLSALHTSFGARQIPAASLGDSLESSKKPEALSSDGDDDEEGEEEEESDSHRFRAYQESQWAARLEDLRGFKRENGHCRVPNKYKKDPQLARWVKRQRYQRKLYNKDDVSTMSSERIQLLNEVGFVWDAQSASWNERLDELKSFQCVHGHCNVPTGYDCNRRLARWVKAQRRQYKAFTAGKPSTLTDQRIADLETVGFEWWIR